MFTTLFIMLKRFDVLKNFKKSWHKKTPKQKWLAIYSVSPKLFELISVRVLSDLKVFWFSYSGVMQNGCKMDQRLQLNHFLNWASKLQQMWDSLIKKELNQVIITQIVSVYKSNLPFYNATFQNVHVRLDNMNWWETKCHIQGKLDKWK